MGPLYSLLLPPLQAPDEVAYFDREYILSEGHCIADPDLVMPQQAAHFHLIYPNAVEKVRRVTPAELVALASTPLDESGKAFVGYKAGNTYSCVPFVPAAVAMTFARHLHVPVLDLMYLGRLANLATYLAIVYVALLWMPDLRLLLCGLALMPMTLHQAASLSADSLTFATAFLLSAYILKLAFGPQQNITARDQAILAVIVAINALSKFNLWTLLLMFIIPASKFRNRRQRWMAIGLQVGLACLIAITWQILNRPNVIRFGATRAALGIQVGANLRYVYHEPVLFVAAMVRTIGTAGHLLLTEFVGNLGWLCVPLPFWDVFGYTALLLLIALTQTRNIHLTRQHRKVLASIVIAGVVSTFIVLFSFEATQKFIDEEISRGRGLLPGIQGRYFIPIALPFFLLFSNRRFHVSERVTTILAIGVITLSSLVGLNRIRRMYYVSSSTQPANAAWVTTILQHRSPIGPHYEGDLVQRPGPTPEDGKVYVVRDGTKHWVLDGQWFLDHGYHVPGDLLQISRMELDAIPTGEPVSTPLNAIALRYENQLVRRPGPTPEDGKVYVIQKGLKHWVTDYRWAVENGFHWPNDVKMIPQSELDPIPLGEPRP